MAFKSLETSFIYNHLNRSNGLTNNIATLLQSGLRVSQDLLEEPLMIIMKNFKYPLKYKIKEALDDGRIVLLYNEKGKLPTSMPFFLTKAPNGEICAIISIDIYGVLTKEKDSIRIDAKKLYCLLESAYMARIIHLYGNPLSNSTSIITDGSHIYSSMFIRVLNKKYSLNVDKNRYHKVIFLASKFFLINILGLKDNNTTFNYAIKNCPGGNILILEEVNKMTSEEDFKNFETFINLLIKPELALGFKDLNVRNYLEAFIIMYDASALLALESFPYFIYNINSVRTGAYINNQYVLDAIVDKSGGKIYNTIVDIER